MYILQLNELYDTTGAVTLLLHSRGHLDSAIVPRFHATPVGNGKSDDFFPDLWAMDINDILRIFESWVATVTNSQFTFCSSRKSI